MESSAVVAASLFVPSIVKASQRFSDERSSVSRDINQNIKGYEWMKYLDDSMLLTDMSIPGTHNSAAGGYSSWEGGIGSDYAECQKKDVKHQLETGFRFLDLRIDCDQGASGKDKMKIFHGAYYCCTLQAVMLHVTDFLQEHPFETVLIRFKQENDGSSPDVWNSVFDEYMHRTNTYGLPFEDYMYKPEAYDLPNLGRVRGKFVVISESTGLDGFQWNFATVQDNYWPYDENEKRRDVKELLKNSVLARENNTTLYINFLSANTPFSGPDTWAECLLPYISDLVKPYQWDQFGPRQVDWFRTGVVMHDIPHEKWEDEYHGRAEKIYITNKGLMSFGQ